MRLRGKLFRRCCNVRSGLEYPAGQRWFCGREWTIRRYRASIRKRVSWQFSGCPCHGTESIAEKDPRDSGGIYGDSINEETGAIIGFCPKLRTRGFSGTLPPPSPSSHSLLLVTFAKFGHVDLSRRSLAALRHILNVVFFFCW